MSRKSFSKGVDLLLEREKRYARRAYFFLHEALDYTLGQQGEAGSQGARHVRGADLACGFRDHALTQFGPLAAAVMEAWGIRRSEDVGGMVYGLIGIGAFGRSEDDRPEDFDGLWDLADAFVEPYLPPSQQGRVPRQVAAAVERVP